jgi:hypothetical protein
VGGVPGFIYSPQGSLWGDREIIGFGSRDFSVRMLDREYANQLIRANHYSRTTYNNSLIHLGVWTVELLGVLQFGQAMNPQSMAGVVAGTKADEYLELNRMWLHDDLPRNSESRAISYGLSYIKRKFPKVAWVQSFADERCGRHGVVYQAANFIYCGEHTSVFWELDGEMYHNSAMTRNDPGRGKRPEVLQANKERAVSHSLRQFRYIYFLKRAFRARLKLTAKPYPKHASEGSMASRFGSTEEGRGQIPDDAPISEFRVGGGGAELVTETSADKPKAQNR